MYCRHCGKEIPSDSTYCPYCGSRQDEMRDDSYQSASAYSQRPLGDKSHTFALLSLIFGALGGLLGLVFGLLGLTSSPNKSDKVMDIVGISLWVGWMVFAIVYFALVAEGKIPSPYTDVSFR
jgi:hypothetical protein